MEETTISLYDFNELPENVQNKVLDNQRLYNVNDGFWSESVKDIWNEKLESWGFENPEICFSGFGCQGDGACFTCDGIDLEKYTDRLIMQTDTYSQAKWLRTFGLMYNNGSLVANIIHDGGMYSHERSTSLRFELFTQSEVPWQRIGVLTEDIEDQMVEISKAIFKDLEGAYNSLTGDEDISEALIASETMFRSNGDIWA